MRPAVAGGGAGDVDVPIARQCVDIDAPPEAVMRVLCDFAAYPRFVPDMEESVVLREDPPRWTVRFALRIIRRLEYTLLLHREDDLHLRWSLVEGAFRANSGGWSLEPLNGGARTRATYTLDIDLGMFIPGSVLNSLLHQNLPAMLAAFKARVETAA
jgi:ribosome-associated toxin RatA of RatAB toxin-antitoxin module